MAVIENLEENNDSSQEDYPFTAVIFGPTQNTPNMFFEGMSEIH